MRKILLTTYLLLVSGVAFAEMVAQQLPYETRLQKFVYDQDRSYEILTRPMSATNIQLAPDEKMVAFPMGDTSMWEIGSVGNNVFIKPKFERLVNPATLVTNKHSYQLLLKSGTSDGIWYQRIQWEDRTPLASLNMNMNTNMVQSALENSVDEKLKPVVTLKSESDRGDSSDTYDISSSSLKDLNFEYSVEGDASFKPSQVFNDGRFTWLQMPKENQNLPAVFIKLGNELALSNFVIKGRYIVVQSLFDEALLKFNDQEVVITKQKNKKWWD